MNLYLKNDQYNELDGKINRVRGFSGETDFETVFNYNVSSGNIFTISCEKPCLALGRVKASPGAVVQILADGTVVDEATCDDSGGATVMYCLKPSSNVVKANCDTSVSEIKTVILGKCSVLSCRGMRVSEEGDKEVVVAENNGKLLISQNGVTSEIAISLDAYDVDLFGGMAYLALAKENQIRLVRLNGSSYSLITQITVGEVIDVAIKSIADGHVIAFVSGKDASFVKIENGKVVESGVLAQNVQSVCFLKNTEKVVAVVCSQGKSYYKPWKE